MIFLSEFISVSETKAENKITDTDTVNDEYCRQLEKSAEEIIKNIIDGEKVKVAVTLESGIEYIYATDLNTDTDFKENIENNGIANNETSDKTQESYIIINTSSGEQPLLISALAPKVRGVVVVCTGGEIEEIAELITEALGTLFDISQNQISVLGAK